ncbi:MAG: cytochrome c [Bacteroidota bacterium]
MFLWLIHACTDDKMEIEVPVAGECDTIQASFSNDVNPIIQSRCAIPGCHVGGTTANGVYLTYDGVFEKVSNGSLINRVVVQRTMPPSGPALTDEEIRTFRCWIESGGPDN